MKEIRKKLASYLVSQSVPEDIIMGALNCLPEMSSVEQVRNLNEAFNVLAHDEPTLLPEKDWWASYSLIKEELKEYAVSAESKDLETIPDDLGDIQFVLDGKFVKHGFWPYKEQITNAVYVSNMSKLCKTQQEVAETQEFYAKQGVNTYVEESPLGGWVIKRESDGKFLKNVNWKLPDFSFLPKVKTLVEK